MVNFFINSPGESLEYNEQEEKLNIKDFFDKHKNDMIIKFNCDYYIIFDGLNMIYASCSKKECSLDELITINGKNLSILKCKADNKKTLYFIKVLENYKSKKEFDNDNNYYLIELLNKYLLIDNDSILCNDKFIIKSILLNVFDYVHNKRMFIFSISEELRSDKEIMSLLVEQHGCSLEFVSNELKYDHDLVLKAVKNDGLSLQFASEELRNDFELVLCAIENTGDAFKFASPELKNNKNLVLKALDIFFFLLVI